MMSQFQPLLYVDGGAESAEAESVLANAGIEFQAVVVKDRTCKEGPIPELLAGLGVFPTLESIRWYAGKYGKVNGKSLPITKG